MNPIDIRPFDAEIHRDHCLRIWEEVGWPDRSQERQVWGLAVTDDLDGPRDLLEALDEAFRLPEPVRDWEF